jgi:hypothetical protein
MARIEPAGSVAVLHLALYQNGSRVELEFDLARVGDGSVRRIYAIPANNIAGSTRRAQRVDATL